MVEAQSNKFQMDFKKESVGGRIMRVRKERGMTQEYLADALSMSQSAYSKMEKGARRISSEDLSAICGLLDVDSNYILGIEPSLSVAESAAVYRKDAPKLSLTITFTEDDSVPDGPLVKRLNDIIRMINSSDAEA